MGREKSGKSSILSFVSVVLLIAVILFMYFIKPIFLKDQVYDDYISAGEHVKEEMLKGKSSIGLTFNTTRYNSILGANNIVSDILKEAIVHTGVPAEGDHICFSLFGGYDYTGSVKELKDGSDDLTLNIKINYRTTVKQEEELAAKAAEILDSLNIDGASDYDKVLAIYRYICQNVKYDYDRLDDDSYQLKYTAYDAAVNNSAVCAGIADLFYYLANTAGLDARIDTNSNHAWNFVKVEDKYYYVDATWDLGRSEDDYEYFLKGWADFDQHMGNVTFGPNGFDNYLVHSELGYDLSDYAYGYDPYPLLQTP
ncbi:MAG: hypothetical protein IKG47_12315 [Oscillospiraceae bacterium]|nr:hypothetical protein [Oscillospiraceae bacterium]